MPGGISARFESGGQNVYSGEGLAQSAYSGRGISRQGRRQQSRQNVYSDATKQHVCNGAPSENVAAKTQSTVRKVSRSLGMNRRCRRKLHSGNQGRNRGIALVGTRPFHAASVPQRDMGAVLAFTSGASVACEGHRRALVVARDAPRQLNVQAQGVDVLSDLWTCEISACRWAALTCTKYL